MSYAFFASLRALLSRPISTPYLPKYLSYEQMSVQASGELGPTSLVFDHALAIFRDGGEVTLLRFYVSQPVLKKRQKSNGTPGMI